MIASSPGYHRILQGLVGQDWEQPSSSGRGIRPDRAAWFGILPVTDLSKLGQIHSC